ncbi:MAG: peptidase, partial [Gammaproteobacteria bacterium]|nr:peptidase [Gammaproteobacteria bacterium]
MTYCLAAKVRDGLVFASDSRTNAGVDHVSTYSKMHIFGIDEERQIVLLSAGNLATTQAVIAKLKRDIRENASETLFTVRTLEDAADLVGRTVVYDMERHGSAVTQAGFSAEVTFIVGGQIYGGEPALYMVYPQGNYISTSKETRYLQIGEAKYGK